VARLVEAGALSWWLTKARIAAASNSLSGRVLDYACGVGALAEICQTDSYVGYDHDPRKVAIARQDRPGYTFVDSAPQGELFDTVAALAFIEHVADPAAMMSELAGYLHPGGTIVLTTPHPKLEWVHTAGAKIGLFSSAAHDEHEDLIDRRRMVALVAGTDLSLVEYRRFLLGANQLFVLRRRS
jgi:2-polyprenyl-3-methyl-5-hydroxy-6-metoxy-1,4-benzoquinol methylase